MSWIVDALKVVLPNADDIGLVVRPIFSGSAHGTLTVRPESGEFGGEIRPANSSVVSVSYSSTVITFKASNTDRRGLSIYNDADKNLYLKEGPGASADSWTVRIPSNSFYELQWPVYTGIVTGFWSVGGLGSAMVTERTT